MHGSCMFCPHAAQYAMSVVVGSRVSWQMQHSSSLEGVGGRSLRWGWSCVLKMVEVRQIRSSCTVKRRAMLGTLKRTIRLPMLGAGEWLGVWGGVFLGYT
jgi:hypothetical protein